MLKKLELVLLILMVAGLVILNRNIGELVNSDTIEIEERTVILDAGHGGSDPGKVGINNALEKEINLEISQKVKALLEAKEIKVIMTRETDEMLCEETADNKKREDMKRRTEMINEIRPFLVVSIHQNSFSDASVSGAQVFYYSGSEESEKMAVLMQNALREVDEQNQREAKANDSYYLLKKTKVPTLIVECGFLSNPEEAEKLVTDEYQDAISNAIVKGIESCFMN